MPCCRCDMATYSPYPGRREFLEVLASHGLGQGLGLPPEPLNCRQF